MDPNTSKVVLELVPPSPIANFDDNSRLHMPPLDEMYYSDSSDWDFSFLPPPKKKKQRKVKKPKNSRMIPQSSKLPTQSKVSLLFENQENDEDLWWPSEKKPEKFLKEIPIDWTIPTEPIKQITEISKVRNPIECTTMAPPPTREVLYTDPHKIRVRQRRETPVKEASPPPSFTPVKEDPMKRKPFHESLGQKVETEEKTDWEHLSSVTYFHYIKCYRAYRDDARSLCNDFGVIHKGILEPDMEGEVTKSDRCLWAKITLN